jgi:predicted nucleotidyltransferase
MSDLASIAQRLGISQRTLRRAADVGMLRATRVSERRVHIPDAEKRYLRDQWELLSSLRGALRTEPNVKLAVLFGSTARGDDGPESDVDILVDLRDPDLFRRYELESRLADAVNRRVQLVRLHDATAAPWFLSEVIDDARVLVDRAGQWPAIAANRNAIAAAGDRELDERARAVLARGTGETR